MTDLEMTKLCAEAMDLSPDSVIYENGLCSGIKGNYHPLHDDAQAMALVKKFHDLNFMIGYFDCEWVCNVGISQPIIETHHPTDTNRAIVECVAKMQMAKNSRHTI